MLVRCSACRGSKVQKKIGGITGTCLPCSGLGHVIKEKEPVKITPIETKAPVNIEELDDLPVKKKK